MKFRILSILNTFLLHPMFSTLQIEAGQYCTFVISSDGSVRACGKGSYGRLGLGDSNNQTQLKKLNFDNSIITRISSSKVSWSKLLVRVFLGPLNEVPDTIIQNEIEIDYLNAYRPNWIHNLFFIRLQDKLLY